MPVRAGETNRIPATSEKHFSLGSADLKLSSSGELNNIEMNNQIITY